MRANHLLWSVAMLLVLVVSMPTMAQDATEASQKTETQSQTGDSNVSPKTTAAVVVTGGAVQKVLAKTNDTDFQSTTSTSLVAVTGAQRVVNVPPDGDTFVITFTANCRLFAASNESSWVEVEIRDGSTPIRTSFFCSDVRWASNSMQVAKTLNSQGNHTIRVYFRTTDASKTALLGDWTLTILQAD